MSQGADSLKSVFYALFANGAVAIAKGVAAWITGSGAMLAEAIHSLADCSNQLLLLIGLKKAKRPPSSDYPLGYGKEIYFWSFLVALVLFTLGGVFSIYEGWHKLHQPEALKSPWLAIGVLVFAMVAEGLALLGCIREINKIRPAEQNYWRWFRDTRRSELMVVFGEDLAALLGLSLALCALLAAIATGNPVYDAWGSMAIGLLLIVVALMIGVEIKALLVGQGVEAHTRAEMVAFLESEPAVDEVFNVLTLQLGRDVMVAVKARMHEKTEAKKLMADINLIESLFRQRFPHVQWLFFEPDVKD
ncbi:MAG: cation diffusion facilitator family transporter [Porticoccaceae bacterium]|nr:cation diffusion facilitator family transporter [Porticoccaceae bacterium]